MLVIAWRRKALNILLFGGVLSLTSEFPAAAGFNAWNATRKRELLQQTHELWYHGFNNYMDNAFPADELRPLTCTGRGPDWDNPSNFGNNDVAANVSMTLIDVLDSFVVLRDYDGFSNAVSHVIDHVTFDVDTKPQVFEITIRALGGLLSGHIFASDPDGSFYLPWYTGQLLTLAHDLGERLLPAFRTSTGIPYARTNLRYGVPKGETIESCTAGGGSLIIEFATLSRLTGDDRFEKAAVKSFFALWNRRSDINLVGNTINIWTGAWTNPMVSSIGAGIDSFFEYALKWYIVSGEVEYLDVFREAYAAIMRYARSTDGFWFHSVHINTGDLAYATVDSLSSFWPGLQVLAGDVDNAIKSHLWYWNLWKRHSGLPEVFDVNFSKAVAMQYPLRPEFIESTFYLYRATKDPFYLDIGERVLRDITLRSKVTCGLCGILDLSNNNQDDRMESFVLSETLKYLALLFDDEHPINKDDSNTVFTTEGHLIHLNKTNLRPMSPTRRQARRAEHAECPTYTPLPGLRPNHAMHPNNIHARGDYEWARQLFSGSLNEQQRSAMEIQDRAYWNVDGWCEVPKADIYSLEFLLSATGENVPEDPTPGQNKIKAVPDGFLVTNVTGIRTHLVSRMDGKGYDISKLGPHAVKTGQKVYMSDKAVIRGLWGGKLPTSDRRPREVKLRFSVHHENDLSDALTARADMQQEIVSVAWPALFGADITASRENPLKILGPETMLVYVGANAMGCHPYKEEDVPDDLTVLVIHRGDCTFVEKLRHAKNAGAAGVIVVSDDDLPLNPSNDERDDLNGLDDSTLLVIGWTIGESVLQLMEVAARQETYITLEVQHEGVLLEKLEEEGQFEPLQQLLWIAGRPVMNMIIVV